MKKKKPPQRKPKKSSAESPPQYQEGFLTLHREGYGFVLAEEIGAIDVFIPRRCVGTALDGDRVLATTQTNPSDGRKEGRIVEIVKRGKENLMGTLIRVGKQFFVEVGEEEKKLRFLIPPKKLHEAKEQQSVGIKVLHYPEEQKAGVAEIIKIFEGRGKQKTETDIIILEHQLRTTFPHEVQTEAKKIQSEENMVIEKWRRDLRHLPFVTIDGENARDFDDAIYVVSEGDSYRLYVSIADVSHYVRPSTMLDREAYQRGTSVYFPDQCIPMLPEELSNDLCSLRPHVDRLTFTCEILFDSQLHPVKVDIYKSVIHSHARLTYKQVARALIDGNQEVRSQIHNVVPMLTVALQLSRKIRQQRFARGSIDFDLPEAEMILNLEEGGVENIIKAERNEIHFLIEEFMISANEAVARFITEKKVPGLYRVHLDPDPIKVEKFFILLNNLGYSVSMPKKITPKFLADVVQQVKGHPEERLITHTLLRSMKQAVYSEKNLGHFGLASTCYTHFTSPIRRYPDLIVHRVLSQILKNQIPKGKSRDVVLQDMARIGAHTSHRERVAMEAEWEAIDLMVSLFMKRYLGESFMGVVSRITKFGFFVRLLDFFVEGLVLLEDAKDDYYIFDEKHLRLRGRRTGKVFKIGTELRVTVAKVDIEERKVYFAPE